MSKVQNPIIGRASGQAGNMVFSTNYGSNIIRTKPITYTEPTGVEHRKKKVKFKASAELAAKVKGIAKTLYPTNAGNVGAYAQLVRDLYPAFDVVNDNAVFKPANAMIGKGPTSPLLKNLSYNSINHILSLSWNDWVELWLRLFPLEEDPWDCSILIISADGSQVAMVDVVVQVNNQTVTATVPAQFATQTFFYSGLIIKNPVKKNQFRTYLATSNAPTVY